MSSARRYAECVSNRDCLTSASSPMHALHAGRSHAASCRSGQGRAQFKPSGVHTWDELDLAKVHPAALDRRGACKSRQGAKRRSQAPKQAGVLTAQRVRAVQMALGLAHTCRHVPVDALDMHPCLTNTYSAAVPADCEHVHTSTAWAAASHALPQLPRAPKQAHRPPGKQLSIPPSTNNQHTYPDEVLAQTASSPWSHRPPG